jgi:putative membrane protein
MVVAMMWWDDGAASSLGTWALMTVMMLVVFGGLVALVIWIARSAAPGPTTPTAPTPEQLLAQRFARGEIDENEFTRQRTLLRG